MPKTPDQPDSTQTRDGLLWRFYEDLWGASPDPIFVVDGETLEFVDVNDVAVDFYGYSREEFLQLGPADLSEEPESTAAVVGRMRGGDNPVRVQRRHRTHDGRIVDVEITTTLLTRDGRTYAMGQVRDVTERERERQALRFTQFAINRSSTAAYWMGKDARFIYVNDQACRSLGYDRDELLTMTVHDIGPDFPLEAWAPHWQEVRERGAFTFETSHQRKDGTLFPVAITVNHVRFAGREYNCAFAVDISERLAAEASARASQGRFETIFDTATEGIIGAELGSMRIRLCNRASCSLLGYSEQELCSMGVLDVHPPEAHERILTDLRAAGANEKYFAADIPCLTRSGEVVFADVSASVIEIDGREVLIAFFTDVTARRQAEALDRRAQEQERHAFVGRVAGKMAHDFNNILGVVLGTGSMLLSYCDDDDQRQDLEAIVDAARKGRELTGSLLMFAKDQEPKLELVDLNDRIHELIKSMSRELSVVQLDLALDPNVDKILVDAGLMHNALANLIQNAIDALGKTERPQLHLRTRRHEDRVTIEIEDNGCGIPEEYLERVFMPSVTLKGSADRTGAYTPETKGSGYGLANAKRCVERHGGTITLRSTPDAGTSVHIELPIISADLNEQSRARVARLAPAEGKRILLVEDEPQLGRVLYTLLQEYGHQVHLAMNGTTAIELATRDAYDLVSLDFVLPDVDGLEVYHRLRVSQPTLPIVFVSGNLEFLQSMVALKGEDPWVDHLAKPFEPVEYLEAIHRWLSQAGEKGED